MEKMVTYKQSLIDYYDECWLERFKNGHNPVSLAMHLGYFANAKEDNDLAKHKTNEFLAARLNITGSNEIYIADFGCGVGGTCLYFAENFPKAVIKGINISRTQIDFANQIKKAKGITEQIMYLVSDYSDTTLEKSTFDVVFGIESICHAPDKLNVYKEAYRILKPKGIFAFIDYVELKTPETTYENDLLHTFRKGWAVDEYIKNQDQDMRMAGFRNISSTSVLNNVYQGIIHSFNKAVGKVQTEGFRQLSPKMQMHLKACIALKELVDRKIIGYYVISAQK